MHEEDDHERLKRAVPRFSRLGDRRQRERPDDEDGAQEEERVRELLARRAEGVREPEEEVREEDEQGDRDAADGALRDVPGVVRDQGQQLEQAERAEGDRRPHAGAVPAAVPEDECDPTERDVRDEVDVAKRLDGVVHGPLPRGDNRRSVDA